MAAAAHGASLRQHSRLKLPIALPDRVAEVQWTSKPSVRTGRTSNTFGTSRTGLTHGLTGTPRSSLSPSYGTPRSYLDMVHGTPSPTSNKKKRRDMPLYDSHDPQWGPRYLTPRSRVNGGSSRHSDSSSTVRTGCSVSPRRSRRHRASPTHSEASARELMELAYASPLGRLADVGSRVFDQQANMDYLRRHRYVPKHRPPPGSMMAPMGESMARPMLGPGAYHKPAKWNKGGATMGVRRAAAPSFILEAEKRGRNAVDPIYHNQTSDYYALAGRMRHSKSFNFSKSKFDRASHLAAPKHMSKSLSPLSLSRTVRRCRPAA